MGGESSGEKSARRGAKSAAKFAIGQGQLQSGVGTQLQDLAGSQGVQALGSTEFTPFEQQQLQFLQRGNENQERTIEQSTREQASARGLFSSQGAITQEALGLADLDRQRAMQQAQLAQQAQGRQFQGLQLRGGLLGQANSAFGGAGGQGLGAAQAFGQQQQMAANQQNNLMNTVANVGMGAASLFSDKQLKDVIGDTEKAIERIMDVKIKEYKYKDEDQIRVGVIAQDLEKIFPELVSEEEGFKKVDYTSLFAILIKAVQEVTNGI